MAEINLLQQNKKSSGGISTPHLTVPGRGSKGFLTVLIFLILVEAAAYGGLYYLRSNTESDIADTENEITSIQSAIDQRRDELDEAIAAQARLEAVETLVAEHVRWSIAWDELATYTLSTSYFVSIEATTEDNRFIVSGTVPTFSDLGKVLLGLELSEKFEHVILESAARTVSEQGSGVGFDITVVMKNDALIPSEG